MTDKTITFSIRDEYDMEMKKSLRRFTEPWRRRVIIPSVSLSVICFPKTRLILPRTTMPATLSEGLTGTKSFRL